MLILARRIGETVVIGNKILCTVFEHKRDGQLKLVFEAPKNIPIHRFEIQKRIMQQMNKGAYESTLGFNETVADCLTTNL